MEKLGIDISEFQSGLDLSKVKAQGYNFVIVRAGYGNLVSQKDKSFDIFAEAAKKNGLELGVYWFSYAINEDDARKEADVAAAVIEKYKSYISLPVFFDWEYVSYGYAVKNGVTPTKTLVTNMTLAFMERIEAHGYKSGYYTNYDYAANYYDMDKMKGKTLWLAHYGTSKPKYDCAFQQTSNEGTIKGYSGKVDTDKMLNAKADAPVETYTEKVFTWGDILPDLIKNSGANETTILKLNNAKKSDVILRVKLPKKTIDQLAKEVMDGKWGFWPFRSSNLKKAGYDSDAVQDRVNELMKKR